MTMRTTTTILALSVLLLAAAPATAQMSTGKGITDAIEGKKAEAPPCVGPDCPVELAPAPKAPATGWKRWTNFIDRELDAVGKADLYGVTSQMPKGYASIKWDYVQIKAGRRYNDKHEIGPVMAPITVPGGKLDTGLQGHGAGHVFQASYGITGNFDWYFELPYQSMHTSFNPKLLGADGKPVKGNNPDGTPDPDYAMKEGFRALYKFLPALGRPVPQLKYDADWVLGDINTGFSWNPWRTPRMSAALTCRVFFPTGRVANPNSSLTLGTGPELDTGIGGWAVGFTQGYDLRLFKYSYWIDIVASSEFSLSYGFEQRRSYPTNFTTQPDRKVLQAFNDPTVYSSFPDLRHLKDLDSFKYTPGFGLSWTAQLAVQVALLGFNFAYGVSHSQEPELKGDYYFIQMAKSLQLLGQNTTHAIQLGASISLMPLYIPVNFAFSWRKVVDGYNALVFDDYWNVVIKTYIPLFRK
jgi:hypothetical protein